MTSSPMPRVTKAILAPSVVLAGEALYAVQGGIDVLDAATGAARGTLDVSGVMLALALDGDTLYVLEPHRPDGTIRALRDADWSARWEHREERRMNPPVTVAGGRVYASVVEGDVFALRADDGAELWRRDIGPIHFTSPTAAGDTIYVAPAVNAPDHPFVYALDAATGDERWRSALNASSTQPLVVTHGTVYVAEHDGVSALSARDGAYLWWQRVEGSTASAPIVAENRLLVSLVRHFHDWSHVEGEPPRPVWHREAWVRALWREDGATLWERRLGASEDTSTITPPVAHDTSVYAGASDGCLYALDVLTGDERWRYQTAGTMLSTPVAAAGVVYVGASDGCVYALRTVDGSLLWRAFVSAAVYAVSGISVWNGPVTTGPAPDGGSE